MTNLYYKDRQGKEYTKYSRKEIWNKLNNNEISIISFLKDMDYPYFQDEWNRILKVYNGTVSAALTGYIAKMNLPAYKNFNFKDKQLTKNELINVDFSINWKAIKIKEITFTLIEDNKYQVKMTVVENENNSEMFLEFETNNSFLSSINILKSRPFIAERKGIEK